MDESAKELLDSIGAWAKRREHYHQWAHDEAGWFRVGADKCPSCLYLRELWLKTRNNLGEQA